MAIYITGSLAYDRLMRFSGKFADSILPDQLHSLSVSFLIDHLDEKLGGNAGNIAYSLYLLGERPTIVSAAGRDFPQYETALRERSLPLDGISIYQDQLTAGCYITTDQVNNQITVFHAAALMFPSSYTFPALDAGNDIAIICPSNPNDMVAHPKLYQEKGIRYIYDPSQQLPVLDATDVRDCIQGAYLLMGNDYEINLIMNKAGRTKAELLAMTQAGIVTTLGEKGSVIMHKDGTEEHVEAIPVQEVLDPTGAGDAYRSGFIKGLVDGKPLVECARLGTVCAAYCIEISGTQTHSFTPTEFASRYKANFPA